MRTILATIAATLALAILAPSAHAADAAPTSRAFATPNVKAGFTPQGMTTWAGRIVVAEFRAGSNSRLVAVNPTTGKTYGQVAVAETHAGGVAIVGGWLYVQDAATVGQDVVRRYSMSAITAAMTKSHKAKNHPVFVRAAGLQQLAAWQFASFMTSDGVHLMSGHHGVGTGARMYTFDVAQATGLLTAQAAYVTTPDNSQGVALLAGLPIFTSGGGHLTVAGVSLAIPSHAEGIVVLNGAVYVAFEGGAKYILRVALPAAA